MFRIDTSTAVGSLPSPSTAGTPGFFSNATPGGGGTPTVVSNDWANMIQEELMSIISADSGITPSKTSYNQVLTAIQYLIGLSAGRKVLSGATTYYVATTGSDSTGGGSSGNPWLTIQHAINYVANSIDLAGNNVTISVADGTYSSGVIVSAPFVGAGTVTLQGNITTPASCIISTSATCIEVSTKAVLTLKGFKLVSSAGNGLAVDNGGICYVTGLMEYGACAFTQIYCQNPGSAIQISGNYKISGSAANHFGMGFGGCEIFASGIAVTLTGTPAYSGQFASIGDNCFLSVGSGSVTFSGSATGKRFSVFNNGVINTSGGGANFLPGSTAGSGTNAGTSPYGLYI